MSAAPMSPAEWALLIVGLISAALVGLGVVTALISAGLGWKVSQEQKLEIAKVRTDGETRLGIESAKVKQEAETKIEIETAKARADADAKIEQARADAQRDVAAARVRQDEIALELRTRAKELADAQRTADVARLALQKHLAEVAERQKHRHLTADQRAKLLSVLLASPIKGVVYVLTVSNDAEAFAFAWEIHGVIQQAKGWTSLGVTRVTLPAVVVGVELWVRSLQNPLPLAVALQQALASIDVEAFGVEKSGVEEGQVELFVGVRP